MGDKVFVNGRAAVHKGSAGKATAFPDVCLCPPTPPAGPVPVPLPNTVVAADLTNGASSVTIEDNPAGTNVSFEIWKGADAVGLEAQEFTAAVE